MQRAGASFVRYAHGVLHVEDVDARAIAQKLQTPTRVYAWGAIEARFRAMEAQLRFAPHLIACPLEAGGNLGLAKRIARLGAGVEITSGGELARAMEAGLDPGRVVFGGAGKSDAELESALAAGVQALYADSAEEVDAIEAAAATMGGRARVCLRVAPELDPGAHPTLSALLRASKLGLDLETLDALLPRMRHSAYLDLVGLSCHLGAGPHPPAALGSAVAQLSARAVRLKAEGLPLDMLGVGSAPPRDPGALAAAAAALRGAVERTGALAAGLRLVCTPGPGIVADAGAMLTRVLYVKRRGTQRFVVLDASAHQLSGAQPISPGLCPVVEDPDARVTPATLVGPLDDESDVVARDVPLPEVARGDLLLAHSAGAGAASVGCNWSGRPRPPEVLVEGGSWTPIRSRQRVEDLWRDE